MYRYFTEKEEIEATSDCQFLFWKDANFFFRLAEAEITQEIEATSDCQFFFLERCQFLFR